MFPLLALEDKDGAFEAGPDGCCLSFLILAACSASSFATYLDLRRYEGMKKESWGIGTSPIPGILLNFREYDGRKPCFRQDIPLFIPGS